MLVLVHPPHELLLEYTLQIYCSLNYTIAVLSEVQKIDYFNFPVKFLSLLFPCFLHHHWSILYTNNFLVRECFYYLFHKSSGVFISGHKLILIFEGREGGRLKILIIEIICIRVLNVINRSALSSLSLSPPLCTVSSSGGCVNGRGVGGCTSSSNSSSHIASLMNFINQQ